MRGEYDRLTDDSAAFLELPPRARRIHSNMGGYKRHAGTTSACAENTGLALLKTGDTGNYLRVRGEYYSSAKTGGDDGGTTSACAENTVSQSPQPPLGWNYLRVRGEYL